MSVKARRGWKHRHDMLADDDPLLSALDMPTARLLSREAEIVEPGHAKVYFNAKQVTQRDFCGSCGLPYART